MPTIDIGLFIFVLPFCVCRVTTIMTFKVSQPKSLNRCPVLVLHPVINKMYSTKKLEAFGSSSVPLDIYRSHARHYTYTAAVLIKEAHMRCVRLLCWLESIMDAGREVRINNAMDKFLCRTKLCLIKVDYGHV